MSIRKFNLFGPAIRRLRSERAISQSELSVRLEVDEDISLSQSDISEIERQARRLNDIEVVAIARILGISLDELARISNETK